ncbi:hypothetical protein N9V34_01830 [Flavobacteriaceae bacterium]|nr:hypothetical protein [Flavobacteriaceae bacterium]
MGNKEKVENHFGVEITSDKSSICNHYIYTIHTADGYELIVSTTDPNKVNIRKNLYYYYPNLGDVLVGVIKEFGKGAKILIEMIDEPWVEDALQKLVDELDKKDEEGEKETSTMDGNRIKQDFLNFIKSVDPSFDENINNVEIEFYWDGGSFNSFTDFYINGEVTDYELENDEKVIWDIITYGNNNGVKIERHDEGTSANIIYDPKTKTIRFGTYVSYEEEDYDFSF